MRDGFLRADQKHTRKSKKEAALRSKHWSQGGFLVEIRAEFPF
jgi:hypothetical protein